MYNSIRSEFKDRSKYYKNQSIYVCIPIFYIVLAVLIIFVSKIDIFNPFYLYIILICSLAVLIFLTYYGVMIITVRKDEKFSFKKILRIMPLVDLYSEYIHSKDINLLVEILKDYGVNTRPKVQEVLRHFQCLLPRKTVGGGQLISVLALTIAVLALLFQDNIYNSENNMLMAIIIIGFVLILYLLFYMFNKDVLRVFGVDALNQRIESAVSEIWIKSMIK